MAELAENYEEGNFRLQARSVFLTYPMCPIEPNQMLVYLQTMYPIKQYYIGRELHENGEPHLHAAITFERKISTRNPRVFDVTHEGVLYHPNIQKPRNWDAVVKYVTKDGNYIDGEEFDDTVSTNFTARLRDYTARQQWCRAKKMVWRNELELPIGPMMSMSHQPLELGKKRHLWIYGEPDLGKTTLIASQLAGARSLWITSKEYRFEQVPQQDEDGVLWTIYDDQLPTWAEISNITAVRSFGAQDVFQRVPGKTRYVQVFWPTKPTVTMIVLANHPPNYAQHQKATLARFKVMKATRDPATNSMVVTPLSEEEVNEEVLAFMNQ